MIDPQLLRKEPEEVARLLSLRGVVLDQALLFELDQQRKQLQVETQQLQAERNRVSKSVGKAKAQGEPVDEILASIAGLGDQLEQLNEQLQQVQTRWDQLVAINSASRLSIRVFSWQLSALRKAGR